MNEEVLKLIHLYSKESKFYENLKELINTLNVKLNSETNNTNDTLSSFYDTHPLEYVNEVIKPILNNMIKQNVEINQTAVPWSNGHDGHWDTDVVEYEIKYLLNEHNITFHISVEEDENTIIHASVFFDDWFHFTLLDYNGELGYYQEDGDRGIQVCDEIKVKSFYDKYNHQNARINMRDFYKHMLVALFLSISNMLGYKDAFMYTFDDEFEGMFMDAFEYS